MIFFFVCLLFFSFEKEKKIIYINSEISLRIDSVSAGAKGAQRDESIIFLMFL